jgi:hypothetical protein
LIQYFSSIAVCGCGCFEEEEEREGVGWGGEPWKGLMCSGSITPGTPGSDDDVTVVVEVMLVFVAI